MESKKVGEGGGGTERRGGGLKRERGGGRGPTPRALAAASLDPNCRAYKLSALTPTLKKNLSMFSTYILIFINKYIIYILKTLVPGLGKSRDMERRGGGRR